MKSTKHIRVVALCALLLAAALPGKAQIFPIPSSTSTGR